MRLIDADVTYRKLSCIMMQVLEHSDEEMNEAMKGYNPSSFVEGFHHAKERILKILDSQPTVDAEPVVHAEWKHSGMSDYYRCTNCGFIPTYNTLHGRCPKCDAKMDGGDK